MMVGVNKKIMKTPKEKAKELVEKYTYVQIEIIEQGMYSEYYPLNISEAKQCALIAVDEIKDMLYDMMCSSNDYQYWVDVRKEIEKL